MLKPPFPAVLLTLSVSLTSVLLSSAQATEDPAALDSMPQTTQPQDRSRVVIPGERIGEVPFTQMERDRLAEIFSSASLAITDFDYPLGEGETATATRVSFMSAGETNPTDFIEIVWTGPSRKQVDFVSLGPAWKLPNGLHVGMSWAELKDHLGPFQILGFRWDGAGLIDLSGTPLEGYGFDLRIRAQPTLESLTQYPAAAEATSGDRFLSSSESNLDLLAPTVTEIHVHH